VKQSNQELEKGIEITEELTQRAEELSKLIPVPKYMYSRARTVTTGDPQEKSNVVRACV